MVRLWSIDCVISILDSIATTCCGVLIIVGIQGCSDPPPPATQAEIIAAVESACGGCETGTGSCTSPSCLGMCSGGIRNIEVPETSTTYSWDCSVQWTSPDDANKTYGCKCHPNSIAGGIQCVCRVEQILAQ